MSAKLLYVDDSGAEVTGWVTYSWIMVDLIDWSAGLSSWLDWRHDLACRTGIPKLYELHATKFLSGQGTPSSDPAMKVPKAARQAIIEEALAVIGATSCLSIGTAYRHTTAHRRHYAEQRADVYKHFLAMIDADLAARGDRAVIVMDGDGTDKTYLRAHRNLDLATRAVVEDPVFQHSHVSQWVQIADLVAWTTYQYLLRSPSRSYAHHWYSAHLASCDMLGAPRRV